MLGAGHASTCPPSSRDIPTGDNKPQNGSPTKFGTQEVPGSRSVTRRHQCTYWSYSPGQENSGHRGAQAPAPLISAGVRVLRRRRTVRIRSCRDRVVLGSSRRARQERENHDDQASQVGDQQQQRKEPAVPSIVQPTDGQCERGQDDSEGEDCEQDDGEESKNEGEKSKSPTSVSRGEDDAPEAEYEDEDDEIGEQVPSPELTAAGTTGKQRVLFEAARNSASETDAVLRHLERGRSRLRDIRLRLVTSHDLPSEMSEATLAKPTDHVGRN